MNTANVMLKVIVLTHFCLSVWGTMASWLPTSYVYVHAALLGCGLWAIGSAQSTDALFMMLATMAFSIFQDILLLALYQPRAYNQFEPAIVPQNLRNEYRFSLGMAILNLILKPFTGFLLYRVYQSRTNDSTFTIPGLPDLGGSSGGGGGYEDIDRGRASRVESANDHESGDRA